ncbi:class I adenylate-forming enzyme family protein [Nocardia sp. NPDC004750]
MTSSISQVLDRAVGMFGDRIAVTDGRMRWTYRELGRRVLALDAALDGFKLGVGDVVGVLAHNDPLHIVAWLAVPRSGRVMNELNTRLSRAELEFTLADSRTRALIVDDDHVDLARSLQAAVDSLTTLIYAGVHSAPVGFVDLAALTGGEAESSLPVASGDMIAGIFYTGGTTGRPKGVQLSHQNLISTAKNALICWGFDDQDAYLHAAPMFHLADGAATLALTWVGGKHVILDAFEPRRWLEIVKTERVTRATLVPTMINRLVSEPFPTGTDCSSLRSIAYGGSPMPRALLQRAAARFGCDWGQVYSMTEGAGITTFLDHRDHRRGLAGDDPIAAGRLASVGRPVVGCEVRILRADGSMADSGEAGEVVVRGETIMRGYLNRPTETAAAFLDGQWYRTGDVGYFDGDGYLFVVDRIKDMIITGGENVYAAEVEAAIHEHPAVYEAAVFGVPDDDWGEVVHAAVVLLPGHLAAQDELIGHTRSRIAPYKAPRVVHFLERQLPRSAAGKVVKSDLRQEFR